MSEPAPHWWHSGLQLLRTLSGGRAVGYLLITRAWQFPAGLFTMWLLLKLYSLEFRDHYYLFSNLLALQTFVELGLPTILVILSSHEWARLQLLETGEIGGDPEALSRLASLDRFAQGWFRVCALILLLGVGAAGWWIVDGQAPVDLAWKAPWLGMVSVNALALIFLPRLSILEGCNQMLTINSFRAVQAITGSVVVWICLGLQAGLWTLVAANLVRCLWDGYLIWGRYRPFFHSLKQTPAAATFDWQSEIWPLQWRLGLQSLASYFGNSLFVPVLYRYGRPGEAGQMGMTWTILSTLQQTSLAWIHTRTPELAVLAAKRDLPQLEKRLWTAGATTVGVFLLGSAGFWCCLAALHALQIPLANGFLPLGTTVWLIVALTIVQIAFVQHAYVRIHKLDPFVTINVISSLAVGGLVWWAGKHYAAYGVALAYAVFCLLYTLPVSLWVMWVYRRKFQAEAQQFLSATTSAATDTARES